MDNNEYLEIDAITAEKIAKRLKEKTMTKSIKINEEEVGHTSILDSKFGRLPYWDESMEYPTDSNGNQLILLAQINFELTPIGDDRFPDKGMLQFFIGTDDLIGCDFDYLTAQNGFRVVYHENINYKLIGEDVRSQGIRANTDLDGASDEYFPFYKEYLIRTKNF